MYLPEEESTTPIVLPYMLLVDGDGLDLFKTRYQALLESLSKM
jgi:hypothetical protein